MISTEDVRHWQCIDCGCLTFARIDEPVFGGYEPGDKVRCVNCKTVAWWPALPPQSSAKMVEIDNAWLASVIREIPIPQAPGEKR